MDSQATHPQKGVVCGGKTQLTPLQNVGHGVIDFSTVGQVSFARSAVRALNDRDFFDKEIAGECMAERIRSAAQTPRNAAEYVQHVEELSGEALGASEDDGVRRSGGVLRRVTGGAAAYASYFAVIKDVIWQGMMMIFTARAIFDARFFNGLIKTPPDFSLNDVNGILDILSSYGCRQIFFFSTDLLNFYYQLPLGSHLSVYMGILCNGITFLPLVLPMGWSWAVWIAHALCWGLILKILSGDVDLQIPESVFTTAIPPSHVTCGDGTNILVVIDTILVISSEEATVKEWRRRIVRNMGDAGLKLKYDKLGRSAEFGGLAMTSTLDGVTWCILEETQRAWRTWASETLTPSAHVLWKALGFLRFVLPVIGWNLARLGSLVGIQSRHAREFCLKSKKDYAVERPSLTPAIAEAKKLILGIDYSCRHPKSHLKGIRCPAGIWYAATDATTTTEAFCFFRDGKPGKWWIREANSEDILGAEANALAWCISEWTKIRAPGDILVVAGDNQAVLRCAEKGWSRCPEIQAAIELVRNVLEFETVVKCDIDTDSNYADIGSRPHEEYSAEERAQRLKETLKCLDDGWASFRRTRKTLFMRIPCANDDDGILDEPAEPDEDEDNVEEPAIKKRRV
jgi:hypothetical protein